MFMRNTHQILRRGGQDEIFFAETDSFSFSFFVIPESSFFLLRIPRSVSRLEHPIPVFMTSPCISCMRLRLANIIVDDANTNWEECVCDADPNPNASTYVTGTRVAEEGVVAKEDEQA